jgi:hypothetical protein
MNGLKKPTKNVSQYSRPSDQNLNPGHSEKEIGEVNYWPQGYIDKYGKWRFFSSLGRYEYEK